MRCYIAGPMTGRPFFSYPYFDECKRWLLDQRFDVISPADLDRKRYPGIETWDGFVEGDLDRLTKAGFRLEDAIREDEEAILGCDAIVLLPGWRYSAGTKRELLFAQRSGKSYKYYTYYQNLSQRLWPIEWEEDISGLFVGTKCEPAEPPAEPAVSPKAALLRDAEKVVCGDRNAQYGPPTQDFHRTAGFWNIYAHGVAMRKLAESGVDVANDDAAMTLRDVKSLLAKLYDPWDIGHMMDLLKISRAVHSPRKRDHYVDKAGYAACAWECVEESDHANGRGGASGAGQTVPGVVPEAAA